MPTIHLISHTHWDREWYLPFQQFRLKLVNMIDQLLVILEEDPLFTSFLLDGQAIILDDYLQIRPECEAQLIGHIQNGRILIGPWYVSPDEFLISPESHIRNLLEGDKICQHFGGKMRIGYLPDTFGHIGQMPQILVGFGINTACLWRGLDEQACELEWVAPDGSSVLLSYLRDSYSNAASLETSDLNRFIRVIDDLSHSLEPFVQSEQILLMNGTDHMTPVRDLTAAITYYQQNAPENNLLLSNLPQYFESLLSDIASSGKKPPVVKGELRSSRHSPLLPNVLSTHISVKQRNHSCETALLKWIEPLFAWKYQFDRSLQSLDTQNLHTATLMDEASIIRYAWKLLMQCHPHDSICGTSIDQVVKEMHTRFDQVDQINHELENALMQSICSLIDTRIVNAHTSQEDSQNHLIAIVVFNPNDVFQSELINLHVKLEGHFSSFEIIDDRGNAIPMDQNGMGVQELISVELNKKALKQSLGMIHEGTVAGMVIRDFDYEIHGNTVNIQATLSDHAQVDLKKWKEGMLHMDAVLADPSITDFIIHAYSDPEIEISFVATDVPQHGFRTYWIRGMSDENLEAVQPVKLNPILQGLLPVIGKVTQIPFFSKLLSGKKSEPKKSVAIIENEFFIIEVHSGAAGISVTDKRTDQVYSGLNTFIDGGDCGDLYNYCPPDKESKVTAKITGFEHLIQKTCQRLIIHYNFHIPYMLSDDRKSRSHELIKNTLTSIFTLVPGVARLDIHTEVNNLSKDHRLRVHFPAPFTTSYAFQDGHFEIVQRAIRIPDYDETWEEPPRPEVPQRQFTTVTDDHTSLTIANRGLPEVEVLHNPSGQSEIAVTLLRCVGWLSRDDISTRKGHAGPMEVPTPGAQMIGRHTFDYSIIPGDKDFQVAVHQAVAFNAPLKAMPTSLHAGLLPSNASFIENSSKFFIITTIKRPVKGPGVVVRGYNSSSSPIEVNLKLPLMLKHATLVNLDESVIIPVPMTNQASINITVDPKKICSILFQD